MSPVQCTQAWRSQAHKYFLATPHLLQTARGPLPGVFAGKMGWAKGDPNLRLTDEGAHAIVDRFTKRLRLGRELDNVLPEEELTTFAEALSSMVPPTARTQPVQPDDLLMVLPLFVAEAAGVGNVCLAPMSSSSKWMTMHMPKNAGGPVALLPRASSAQHHAFLVHCTVHAMIYSVHVCKDGPALHGLRACPYAEWNERLPQCGACP